MILLTLYFTRWQAEQSFNLTPPATVMPQDAHAAMAAMSHASFLLSFAALSSSSLSSIIVILSLRGTYTTASEERGSYLHRIIIFFEEISVLYTNSYVKMSSEMSSEKSCSATPNSETNREQRAVTANIFD